MNNSVHLARRFAITAAVVFVTGCATVENLFDTSMVRLGGTLSGAQEVPPAETSGTGSVSARFDKKTNKLSYEVNYSGLSGPATAAHLHGPAAPGQNAGVVIPFANASSPIRGEATLTAAQAADLLAGRWYVNIHTARYPGGELRAQVTSR